MRILVIEDEAALRAQLTARLTREGFRVDGSGDGDEGLYLASEFPFDAAVVDLGLPGTPGLAIVRRLRAAGSRLPVLVLTARGRWQDKVEGLEAGADDYLAKPFEPEELLLRIEAILRRAQDRPAPDAALSLGRCSFDPDRGELTCDGAVVRLTEAEVALLRQLARNPHEPVDRLELARDTVDPSGRAVDVQVTRLRRKIEDDPKAPRYLQTVRGVGYRLAPD